MILSTDALVVCVLHTAPDRDHLHALRNVVVARAQLNALAGRPKPLRALILPRAAAGLPSKSLPPVAAKTMAALVPYLADWSVVLTGRTAWARAMRVIAMGVRLMSGNAIRLHFHDHLGSALSRLERAGIDTRIFFGHEALTYRLIGADAPRSNVTAA